MICPECNQRYEGRSCPRCGVVKGVVKTSAILIASGETNRVYRSVEEVPDGLKQQLFRSTNGLNSATILIADRQGRTEIAKAIRSLPAASAAEDPKPSPVSKLSPAVLRSTAVILLIGVVALVWVIFR